VVASTGTAYTCAAGTWAAVSGGGGGGFPITLGSTSIASSSTTTALLGLTALNNVRYLSCASELGAQINTAVTSLGATGGYIVLPNCTTATMTTTATLIPPQISIIGYGKNATIVTCSVAGDCFQTFMNPTSHGEIGAEIANFSIYGSNTSGQVLWHGENMNGYTMHDLQFEPYGTAGTLTTCMLLENTTSGTGFTEGNTTYNVSLERSCAPGVHFLQDGGDTNTSFGYNRFDFKVVAQGANYGVTFDGPGFLYNGEITITCNHVGPGGGCVQFINGFSTDSSLGIPNQRLYVTAEENGSGAGVELNVPGTGSTLRFFGNLVNGAYNSSGTVLATTLNDPNNAFNISTNVPIDHNGNYLMPTSSLTIGAGSNTLGAGLSLTGIVPGFSPIAMDIIGAAAGTYAGYQIDQSLQTGGTVFQNVVVGHAFVQYNTTDSTEPFEAISTPTTFANLVKTTALGQFCWDPASQFFGTTCDTGISRTAANALAFGNGTQGNATAAVAVGKINVASARKGTFVCTNAGTITISNTNGVATSDIIITMNTAGGTITTPPAFKTVTAGTGFTVLCGATDTSTYNYDILN
jgi:hypothetical protein